MAYSTQRETSDGTLVLLSISIEYFDRTEIAVLFDGVVAAEGAGWDWVGSTETQISFSPAVTNGVEVMVVRTSDLAEIRHDLGGGAAFTNETMDENFKQILHIAQEARENATIEDVFNNLNLHGYKAINVGNGVAASDAVNMGQMATHDSTIVGYMNAADASADAAAVSAAAALVSENNAAAAAAGEVAAHVLLTDPHAQYVLESAIESTSHTFTAPQRGGNTTDNDLSFDLNATNNFLCTPTAGGTLTFTNHTANQSGFIKLVNGSNYAIAAAATTKISTADLTKISATGTYLLSYFDDGTNTYVVASANLA